MTGSLFEIRGFCVELTHAFATALGRAVTRAIADGTEMPLPLQPARPIPLRTVGRLAPSLVLLKGLWTDARARRHPPAP